MHEPPLSFDAPRPSPFPDRAFGQTLGRAAELGRLKQFVGGLSRGKSSGVILHGVRGSGRTHLLQHTRTLIDSCEVIFLSVDPHVPISSQIVAALNRPPLPQYTSPASNAQAIIQVLSSVPKPLVIAVDDIDDRDLTTRHLVSGHDPSRSRAPILWVLTSRTKKSALFPDFSDKFERLEVPPLSRSAVTEMVNAAVPQGIGRSNLERLYNGSRLPLHLTHDIATVAQAATGASLTDLWPQSVTAGIVKRDRAALAAASLLGDQFTTLELADLLEIPVGALLRPIRGALRAAILSEHSDFLAFTHPLIRDAFTQTLTPEQHTKLASRVATLRIHRSAPAPMIADAVLEATKHPNADTSGLLRAAIAATGPHDLHIASILGERLVKVQTTDLKDDPILVASLIGHLGQSGQLARARTLLEEHEDLGHSAVWLAAAKLEFPFSFTDSASAALKGIRLDTDGEHVQAQLQSMALLAGMLARSGPVDTPTLKMAAETALHSQDAGALALNGVVTALVSFGKFEWGEALRIVSEANQKHEANADDSEWWFATILRATLLRALGRNDEAGELVEVQVAWAEDRKQFLAVALLLLVRASIALDAGELDEAVVHAEAAFRLAEQIGDARLAMVDVASVLIRVARHRGDLPEVRRWQRKLHIQGAEAHRLPVAAELLLIAAETTEIDFGAGSIPDVRPHMLDAVLAVPSITRDIGDDVLRVRLLLALGWMDSVTSHLVNSERRADRSGSPLARAVHLHLSGLVEGSPSALREAATAYRRLERAPLEAAANEDLSAQPDVPVEEATSALRAALSVWENMGAHRDCARVASKLRRLGVRISDEHTPAAPGLTVAETRVVEELLKRQSTAQIAAVLFISPNTVSVHLRRIYAKAGVRSRSELIRLLDPN